jgi:hypothetical protein
MKYTLDIVEELFSDIQLVSEQKNAEIVEFFDELINSAVKCEPNVKYHIFSNKEDRDAKHKLDHPTWVIRGYYPTTHILFKAVIIKTTEYMSHKGPTRDMRPVDSYWLSVKRPVIRQKKMQITSEKAAEIISEHQLVDAEPLIKIRAQRIMTPVGMEPLRYGKGKSDGCKDKKSDKQSKNN